MKLEDQYKIVFNEFKIILIDKLLILIKGKVFQGVKSIYNELIIFKGMKFMQFQLCEVDYISVDYIGWMDNDDINSLIVKLLYNYSIKVNEEVGCYKCEKFNISIGDELFVGVFKLVKVYMVKKCKFWVGDKFVGCYGNKGIVFWIVCIEDMLFLEDGIVVDIVLNLLGVFFCMNLGQIFEIVLGWVGEKLDMKFGMLIFDGVSKEEIDEYIQQVGLLSFGQMYFYDGEIGDCFYQ